MSKILQGTVVSTKADKTIVISVTNRKTHPLYKKQYSMSNKIMAHDENNECLVGDEVTISETRPISRRKRFSLLKIVKRPQIREEDKIEALAKDEEAVMPLKKPKAQKQQSKEVEEEAKPAEKPKAKVKGSKS